VIGEVVTESALNWNHSITKFLMKIKLAKSQLPTLRIHKGVSLYHRFYVKKSKTKQKELALHCRWIWELNSTI
jgi:hypothetical protein